MGARSPQSAQAFLFLDLAVFCSRKLGSFQSKALKISLDFSSLNVTLNLLKDAAACLAKACSYPPRLWCRDGTAKEKLLSLSHSPKNQNETGHQQLLNHYPEIIFM